VPSSTGPVVPRRRLGAELKAMRERSGLLLDDVARRLEFSASKISRLETGKGIPKARDIRDMLDTYGVSDRATRDRLLRWAREGQQQGWWGEYSDVLLPDTLLPDHLDRLVALESEASSVDEFQQSVVPGLLQVEPYARAIITELNSRYDPEQVERLVQLRLKRQERLTRRDRPLRLRAIIDEGVLHREIGGPAVARDQLAALLRAGRRRTVSLRVLAFAAGVHQAIAGTFQLLHFADEADRDVVYLESHSGNTYLEGDANVARYEQVLDAVSHQALDEADSAGLIESIIERMS
jgi:transcriptional regulator with XRE-family HTH domain